MTFNKILRSTKIKTIFRRKLYINVLSTKIKKKYYKRITRGIIQNSSQIVSINEYDI